MSAVPSIIYSLSQWEFIECVCWTQEPVQGGQTNETDAAFGEADAWFWESKSPCALKGGFGTGEGASVLLEAGLPRRLQAETLLARGLWEAEDGVRQELRWRARTSWVAGDPAFNSPLGLPLTMTVTLSSA